MRTALERIQNPEAAYRSLPFWSWNDKLDPAVLRDQLDGIVASGSGGAFMHARGGLETPYLSEEWFDCIGACLEQAEHNGAQLWVYDEEGWPSGYAGGRVPARGEPFYARGLVIREIASPAQAVRDGEHLALYGRTGACVTRLTPQNEAERFETYYEARQTASPYYIDVLNADAVAAFIEETHERYQARFPDRLPGTLRGFFTDEPRLAQEAVPWSAALPGAFLARYGKEILDSLPGLYLECAGCEQARYEFWSVVSDLFVHAYMKQQYDWCESHGCRLTGHVMMEESLYSQMTGTAGSMPFYEFMHMPGVDSLRRMILDPRIPKQVGSVAEQLGKKQVLTESFALCGWDVSFAELRHIVGWQFVNGVNMLCQHLQAYSLRGLRKRDYPPSHFYQQTWWEEYRRFNDYVARLSALLCAGEKRVDLLLLHPMRSGWVCYDGTNNADLAALDADFARACETLSGLHLDYHLGDEGLLERHGSVQNGRLWIGNASYSAAVLPSMRTIAPQTLVWLLEFARAGGTILSFGEFPRTVAGQSDTRLAALRAVTVSAASAAELYALAAPCEEENVHILNTRGEEIADIRCCRLKLGDEEILYLVNQSKTARYPARMELAGARAVSELLLETAQSVPVAVRHEDGKSVFEADVLPMQSRVFCSRRVPAQSCVPAPAAQREVVYKLPDGAWSVVEMEENAWTLDACAYRVDGGAWQEKTSVILIMRRLLELRRACALELLFTFDLAAEPADVGPLTLVLERPEQFVLSLNGAAVSVQDQGAYKDISFRRLDISGQAVRGRNELVLTARFYQSPQVYHVLFDEDVYETEFNKLTYDMELESLYLLGNFGVYSDAPFVPDERNALWCDGGFTVRDRPEQLAPGTFTTQGLCFFAGKLTVEKTLVIDDPAGDRILLDLGDPRAAMVRVAVNGKELDTLLWAPYVCDVTGLLRAGENTIRVTLFASNRNLLGPHHHAGGELYNVGPLSFAGRYSWVDRPGEAADMDPALMEENFWSDRWSFVTFGI